jgi:hypothetical protein
LVVPAGVLKIEECSFKGCIGLTQLELSVGVREIEPCAFAGCSGLTELELPSSVTTIGNSAFSRCSGLTRVAISSPELVVAAWAFIGCSKLARLALPPNLTEIGRSALVSSRLSVLELVEPPFGVVDSLPRRQLPQGLVMSVQQWALNGVKKFMGHSAPGLSHELVEALESHLKSDATVVSASMAGWRFGSRFKIHAA